MLVGGLMLENVGDVFRLNGVIGVDVSGGVEINGVKDFNKIVNFVKNVKKQVIIEQYLFKYCLCICL